MECADIAAFTFAMWQIRSCLFCKFLSPGATVSSFQSIFHVFRQEKWIAFIIEASTEICKVSKECVRTCKDCVIGREITTLLKIAVDTVIGELRGSSDYFASPLLMEKNN